jgi:hypothetical protein
VTSAGRDWVRRGRELAAACCVLSGAATVAGAETPSIVLIGTQGSLSSQIEADLTRLGFQVLPNDPGGGTPASDAAQTPRELQAAARAAGAEAAVAVRPSALGVEVWLVDRVTGKTLSREVLHTGAGAEQERVIAVRIVELLRASLLELQLPSGAEGEVRATPALQALVGLPSAPGLGEREPASAAMPAPSYGAFRLEGGLGLGSSIGATSLTPLGTLGGLWQPTEHLAIGLFSLIPLASADVSDREGSARISTWEVHAGPRIYPLSASGPLRPFIDVGLALLWFQIEATRAESPLIATSDNLLTAGAHASLGLTWQLSSHFSLYSTAGASVAALEPVVQFAGRDVLTLAQPLAFCTFGVEYRATSEASRDW